MRIDRLRYCAWACLCLAISGTAAQAAEPLQFENVLERVADCSLDIGRYRGMWAREDALILNLPAGGAIHGIVIAQFYMAPGRNGSEGDYGVILNAALAQVANRLPELATALTVNGRQRRLASLASETGKTRDGGKSLLLCRGGARI